MRFAFIERHRPRWPVAAACRALRVSASGFYAWRGRPRSPRRRFREELAVTIRRVHDQCRGVYGSPRLTRELRDRGIGVCENTVAKVMRAAGVRARGGGRRSVPRTTDAAHAHPIAPNVLGRRFAADGVDRKWACDITYVRTDDGWLYLAAVMDLCSRRIVGWSMADHLRAELAEDALEMALLSRRPGPGLVHHSDRGVQYACGGYRERLSARGIVCSMSRRGNCYDNAAIESFWSTLKRELVNDQRYQSHGQARASIFEYIEVFYNRKRRHSSIGYMSPEAFEAAMN